MGIDVIGTLRIIAEAKKLGHVDAAKPLILEMQSSGYRFDLVLIRRFLETLNEA
jgi:predicted nucleic acid-binding protein